MNYGDYTFIAAFLQKRIGQTITPDKTYLIENRLAPLARECGLPDVSRLIEMVRRHPDSKLAQAVIDAMSVGETMFFRDGHPFETLRRFVIPQLMERRTATKVLRFWSTACANGQEPYSLALLLKEHFALDGWYINLVASDLNATMLARARNGNYSDFEVQRGMPPRYLDKYFDRRGERWSIKPPLRDMVEFRQCDLTDDFSGLGTFDVVLCRNVLVYFDQWSQAHVLKALAAQLTADGVLVLGDWETAFGLDDYFTQLPSMRGIYCRRGSTAWQQQMSGERIVTLPPLQALEIGHGRHGGPPAKDGK